MSNSKKKKNYNKVNYNKNNYKNSYYNNINNSYKNKNKQENKNRVSNNNSHYKKDKSLEHTTRIRIDEERLYDYETLDTSFLDGRSKKAKISKEKHNDLNKKRSEEIEILDDDIVKKSKNGFKIFGLFIIILIIGILLFFAGFSCYHIFFDDEPEVIEKVKKVVEIKNDDNYLFLGDSITDYYDLDKYYVDMPVVNSGIAGNTTKDILNNMKKRVYDYNPSKIFLLIGTNDPFKDIEFEETIENLEKIVSEIKKNRPYAKLYLESILPINNTDDDKINHEKVSDKRSNENIIKMNKEIKRIADENDLVYINLYDKLLDEEGNLKLEYTKEGLHLSDKGYEVFTDELMKYVKE